MSENRRHFLVVLKDGILAYSGGGAYSTDNGMTWYGTEQEARENLHSDLQARLDAHDEYDEADEW